MKKTFRPWQVDQNLLLPPSVHDFVPAGHVAHFVRDLVREELDLSAITDSYSEARGYPPYDPWMMTALLLYGYAQGVYSSRRLARACEERVDFMAVVALNQPDFRTISDFRKRHREALSGLFVQVLQLCRQAGLVKLGHVALEKDRRSLLATDQPYSGLQERSYSEETAAAIDGEVRRIVDETFEKTVNLLRGRRDTLERIACKLLEKETLDEREIAALARIKQVAEASA